MSFEQQSPTSSGTSNGPPGNGRYAGSRELELPGEVVEKARQPLPIKIGVPIHWCLPCAR